MSENNIDRLTAYRIFGKVSGCVTLHREFHEGQSRLLEVKSFTSVKERREIMETLYRKHNIQRFPHQYYITISVDEDFDYEDEIELPETTQQNEQLKQELSKPAKFQRPPAIYTNQSEWQRFVNTGS